MSGSEIVTNFEFDKVPLEDLTEQMQKLTGINLIYDKDIAGQITIHSPRPITVGDAWKAYLTALNLNGYTLVKSGAFYKVVRTQDLRSNPTTKMYTGDYTPDTDNYVMRIIPLRHVEAREITRAFRRFVSQRTGNIFDIQQTNTIIIQDTGSNVNRLARLIRMVDVRGHEESLQIIPTRHASAQEIARLLDELLQQGPRARRARGRGRSRGRQPNISRIIAEPRTNSIIAMANAEGAKQLRELVAQLDVEAVADQGGRIHVYYLNHGDAKTLAETLTGVVSGAQRSAQGGGGNRPAASRRNLFSAGRGGAGLFSGDVRINPDVENNALVVTASPTDYLTIKNVIAKLDIPRDQVYVEGLIMETNVNRGRVGGTSVIGAYGMGNARRAGFQGSGDLINLLTNNITSLSGLFAGFGIGKEVEIPGPNNTTLTVNSVNGLIKAVATSSNANVLATPQILALDNTEAEFEMGESVPTPVLNTTAAGTTRSTTREDITLNLKITPQINKVTRFVKLKIDQKIDDFSPRELPEGLNDVGVAITKRSAVTTVVVRDRDTIAMGGLMRDKETVTTNKVPLLGDIPLLGWLFKNKETSVEKVNLLLFLTPKILANYQRDAAGTVKDLLNRRNRHLEDVQGGDDPFKSSVKGLYEKADEQGGGPLYDEDETREYLDTNEGPGIGMGGDGDAPEPPDYQALAREIAQAGASPR